jgi:hypothetical protein
MSALYGVKLRRKGARWDVWKDTQNRPLLWGNPRAAAMYACDMLDRPDIIAVQVYEVQQ